MLIGKVLKLPPRGVSYLEATLHLTEKYMTQHAEDIRAGVPIVYSEGGKLLTRHPSATKRRSCARHARHSTE